MKKMLWVCCLVITITLHSPFSTDVHAAPAPVPQTGQTACYNSEGTEIFCAGTGQDGDIKDGVAWPIPRFTDNSNGTVTDTLTGLIWLKNANCFGTQTWDAALASSNTLANGACGLSDGSTAGQWRLPSIRELGGLVDRSRSNPALPAGHPFTGVQSFYYWSGSTGAGGTGYAWGVYMVYGSVDSYSSKTGSIYVWPVRSGQ
ncbi:MAG: DUF1566 domain-containing protein [Desulfuromonadaceae bacterium]|nr:DUF1566 domain-containing protein [Desulfuromonadaceae bacterium]